MLLFIVLFKCETIDLSGIMTFQFLNMNKQCLKNTLILVAFTLKAILSTSCISNVDKLKEHNHIFLVLNFRNRLG